MVAAQQQVDTALQAILDQFAVRHVPTAVAWGSLRRVERIPASIRQGCGGILHSPAPLFISPAIPHEGIVVGEMEGWRAWGVSGTRLVSWYVDYVWPTDGPAEGDPSQMMQGIHAYKTRERCEREMQPNLHVIGRVRLWGEVVEHENGYRGQYGRVVELVSFPRWGSDKGECGDPQEICRAYGVELMPEATRLYRKGERQRAINWIMVATLGGVIGIVVAMLIKSVLEYLFP